MLGAIGAVPRDRAAEVAALRADGAIDEDEPATAPRRLADDPAIAELLRSRNGRLAAFWLNPQDSSSTGPFQGRDALVVDAEDRFTTMLAHQLRHLGLEVRIVHWSDVADGELDEAGLVVSGPGPGDPRDRASARMRRMREVSTIRHCSTGLAPPERPVPAPRGTKGTPWRAQQRTIAATSAVVSGKATASGRVL